MFNLLSKINMSMIGSKLASLSPLMLNTLTTAEVTSITSTGMSYLLDIIVKFIIKVLYAICTFALNIIDFFQYVINKIIGLGDEYIVFDIETTGLSVHNCKITEIGAVRFVGGKVTEVFNTFVDPGEHIPKNITELTGTLQLNQR